jgi:hypothetical protein
VGVQRGEVQKEQSAGRSCQRRGGLRGHADRQAGHGANQQTGAWRRQRAEKQRDRRTEHQPERRQHRDHHVLQHVVPEATHRQRETEKQDGAAGHEGGAAPLTPAPATTRAACGGG